MLDGCVRVEELKRRGVERFRTQRKMVIGARGGQGRTAAGPGQTKQGMACHGKVVRPLPVPRPSPSPSPRSGLHFGGQPASPSTFSGVWPLSLTGHKGSSLLQSQMFPVSIRRYMQRYIRGGANVAVTQGIFPYPPCLEPTDAGH